MLSTLSGIVMLVMLLRSTKEYSSMLVTVSGIVTFVSLLRSLKASFWILATDLPPIVLGIISDPDAFLSQPVIATVSPSTSCLKCRLAGFSSGGLAKLLSFSPHPNKS